MTPIFRWNGEYFGFIQNGRLFNAVSEYLGWVTEDGEVWCANGSFLGEIEEESYILRRTSMAMRANRAVRATPVTPVSPARRANRAGRALRSGQVDALDEFQSV